MGKVSRADFGRQICFGRASARTGNRRTTIQARGEQCYYSGFMCKMQAPILLPRRARQNLQKPAVAAPQTYLRRFLCDKNIFKKCKKRLAFCLVVCYNNQALRRRVHKLNRGAFPSGQWGQTVNLLLNASVVRIHQLPPTKDLRRIPAEVFCCGQRWRDENSPSRPIWV